MSANLRRLILKSAGVLLVVLGALHLGVTPFIRQFIAQNAIADRVEWFTPPMLLNHTVVGILLLPLGFLTYYSASSAVAGERWALVVVRTSALAVALLPVTLSFVMGDRYFGAAPFLAATIIVSLASLLLLASAFWPVKSAAV